MGFCTSTHNGREVYVCDGCNVANGRVSKRRCPFGYCPPSYLCQPCNVKHGGTSKRKHREFGCEVKHEKYMEEERQRNALLESGAALRCSALSVNTSIGPMVHVLFRLAGDSTIGFLMENATYDAIPLGVNATPEDYRKHGALYDAPPTFESGATTKQLGVEYTHG